MLALAHLHTPGPSEVEASAELGMPDAVRRNGRVLIQKRIRCPKLQALRLGKVIAELIDRLKDRRQGIGADKRIGWNLRQRGCVYVELLPQFVSVLLDLRWLARLRSGASVHTEALTAGE
jgi:hypothetical protein